MKLVIGLGNPGKDYQNTRHNLGWLVVDALTVKLGAGESLDFARDKWHHEEQFEADLAKMTIRVPQKTDLLLAKPTTFVNNSGRAVERIRAYYKLEPVDLIVVHDDLDLPLGTVRIRLGGQTAGHNGVGSLIHHLGTDQFWRVRIGIGNDHPERHTDTTGFVLKPFAADERETVERVIDLTTSWLLQSLTSGNVEETTLIV